MQIVNNGQIIKHLAFSEPDEEQAYYAHFYRHHFDRERLQQAIGETDENGCAKNVREVSQWAGGLGEF